MSLVGKIKKKVKKAVNSVSKQTVGRASKTIGLDKGDIEAPQQRQMKIISLAPQLAQTASKPVQGRSGLRIDLAQEAGTRSGIAIS